MAAHELHKVTVRNKLKSRREPYWGAPVERGLFVGYRRLEHGGSWVVRYRTDDGQRHLSLGIASEENDYEAAKREARRWRKTIDAGVSNSDVQTVADACADYVKTLRAGKRAATAADAERRFLRTVDNDPLGGVKLSKLRERHMEDWRQRMEAGEFAPLPAKRGRPPTIKPMTPAALKRTLTTLKAALNHAVRKRYVSPDKVLEWRHVQPEKDSGTRRELYLDRTQRRALLDAATGNVRDLVECVILTGCRPGDPAAMLRKDYDARTGSATFRTKGHLRTVPLSPAARELFDRLAKSKLPRAHLFTTDDGKPWQAKDWSGKVKEAVTKADLPHETVLYTLRHSWITDAIISGIDLLTVAKLVGTSLAMIEKHYGHLVQGVARDKLATIKFV